MKIRKAIIIMSIFSALFGCDKKDSHFVSEKAFKKNLANQVAMMPETLAQLRKHGVTEEMERDLDFFFYTNEERKASTLAETLTNISASVEFGVSAHDPKVFVVQGCSKGMVMTEAVVAEWVRQMVQLGYEHDCDFDGWGTSVD